MKLKTLTALGLTLALTAGCLAGCGGTSDTEEGSAGDDAGAETAEKTRIALVLPGKKDDVSFAVTRIDEEQGVAIGIITRIIKQNL